MSPEVIALLIAVSMLSIVFTITIPRTLKARKRRKARARARARRSGARRSAGPALPRQLTVGGNPWAGPQKQTPPVVVDAQQMDAWAADEEAKLAAYPQRTNHAPDEYIKRIRGEA